MGSPLVSLSHPRARVDGADPAHTSFKDTAGEIFANNRATSRLAFAVKAAAGARWEPARHEKDDWLDQAAKHRMIFDTTTADGLTGALRFASNYMDVNRYEYGLANSDLAVLIVVRHRSVSTRTTHAKAC